jgi:hypothetical protein
MSQPPLASPVLVYVKQAGLAHGTPYFLALARENLSENRALMRAGLEITIPPQALGGLAVVAAFGVIKTEFHESFESDRAGPEF